MTDQKTPLSESTITPSWQDAAERWEKAYTEATQRMTEPDWDMTVWDLELPTRVRTLVYRYFRQIGTGPGQLRVSQLVDHLYHINKLKGIGPQSRREIDKALKRSGFTRDAIMEHWGIRMIHIKGGK